MLSQNSTSLTVSENGLAALTGIAAPVASSYSPLAALTNGPLPASSTSGGNGAYAYYEDP